MPINPNFFYFERKCVVCGAPILLAQQDLHKPPIPCARCVRGGTTTFNDKPPIRLTFEEHLDDDAQ
jgi:hypothetical protein